MTDATISPAEPSTRPQSQSTRISHLDILRGFALLGILLMNIQSFSMPSAAYLNPMAWGDLQGANFGVWAFSHLFADLKFIGLFSILFGAGVCLFAQNAQAKLGSATLLHYKRNAWLLLFGLIHAHFIWYGDILYSYALCSFWVFWFRNKSPRFLILSSLLCLSVASLYSLFVHFSLTVGYIPAQSVSGIMRFWQPGTAQLEHEIAAYTGDMLSQLKQRHEEALFMQTDVFLSTFIWRAGGMMLLGMALFKSGVLSGQKSTGFYVKLTVIGLALGFATSVYGLQQNLNHQFALDYSMFFGSQFNYWGSVLTTLGYIGLINLAINFKIAIGLQTRLAAVGQMAFSNYIFHSVVATFIFYGHGFGLYSQVQRVWQLALVLLIWVFQLWASPLWLKHYRFGPLEWLWRSLTYWQRQPLKRVSYDD
jgi:uncharacterized protein